MRKLYKKDPTDPEATFGCGRKFGGSGCVPALSIWLCQEEALETRSLLEGKDPAWGIRGRRGVGGEVAVASRLSCRGNALAGGGWNLWTWRADLWLPRGRAWDGWGVWG